MFSGTHVPLYPYPYTCMTIGVCTKVSIPRYTCIAIPLPLILYHHWGLYQGIRTQVHMYSGTLYPYSYTRTTIGVRTKIYILRYTCTITLIPLYPLSCTTIGVCIKVYVPRYTCTQVSLYPYSYTCTTIGVSIKVYIPRYTCTITLISLYPYTLYPVPPLGFVPRYTFSGTHMPLSLYMYDHGDSYQGTYSGTHVPRYPYTPTPIPVPAWVFVPRYTFSGTPVPLYLHLPVPVFPPYRCGVRWRSGYLVTCTPACNTLYWVLCVFWHTCVHAHLLLA